MNHTVISRTVALIALLFTFPAFADQYPALSLSCSVSDSNLINQSGNTFGSLNYADNIELQIEQLSFETDSTNRLIDTREFHVSNLRIERKNGDKEVITLDNYVAEYAETHRLYDDESILLRYQNQKMLITVRFDYDENQEIVIKDASFSELLIDGASKGSWYLLYSDAQEGTSVDSDHELNCSINKGESKKIAQAALGPYYSSYNIDEAVWNRIKNQHLTEISMTLYDERGMDSVNTLERWLYIFANTPETTFNNSCRLVSSEHFRHKCFLTIKSGKTTFVTRYYYVDINRATGEILKIYYSHILGYANAQSPESVGPTQTDP